MAVIFLWFSVLISFLEGHYINQYIVPLSMKKKQHSKPSQTLAKDTKGKRSISSCVSSPLCPLSWPLSIRAAVTVGTPIPKHQEQVALHQPQTGYFQNQKNGSS